MALPKAIQRQLDEATVAEQNLQQSANEAQATVQDVSQLQAPPVAQETPPQPAPPAPVPAPADDWQQKYRSLQGLFAQKTSELQTQVKAYESQMADLQKQVNALATLKNEAPTQKPQADSQDIENFGADMIEMVQRYAEQVFQRMASQFGTKAAELETRLAGLETQVVGVSNKADSTLEQQFYATLGGLVPDWEQVNADPRWLQWLAEVDPVYGAPRQAALDAAHQRLDATRTATVFKAFKSSFPTRQPESLANQVAPSGASTPAPSGSPAQKPYLSAKSVEKFYKDLAQGRFAGRPEEAARLEAEIDLAAAEGRIR